MSNTAAEEVFIAGLIKHPKKLLDYIDHLTIDDFKQSASRLTFEVIRSLVLSKDVETVTKSKLVAEAKSLGHGNYLSVTKNGDWIDKLFQENITEQELDSHFLSVKRESLKENYKTAIEETGNYLDSTDDPLSLMISKVEDKIINQVHSLDRGDNVPLPLNKDIWSFIEGLADDPGNLGLDVSFPVWQNRVGQIRNGGVTFIAATAKSGKSQLALQIAYKAAVQGLPVLLLDSELNHNDQRIRLAGISAKVPYQFIETGFWRRSIEQLREHGVNDDATLAQIIECGKRLKDSDLRERINNLPITYQSISGMEVSQVIPHARRWILQKVKPNRESKQAQCLIVYDYIKLATLQELKGSRNVAEWQMHGINMALLHDLMKKYNIPCIAFGQTNNEIDDGFKCVAGGKRISENATSISYLKKKTDDERSFDPSGTHFMKIFGGRYGAGTGDKQINFDVDLSCGDFKEIGLSTVNFNIERQKRIDEYKKSKESHDDHD